MDIRQLVLLILQVSIFLTVVGFGLHATRDDLLYLVRRPSLLARTLTAMFVIMPAAVIAGGAVVQLHPAVEIALVALGISPMPPLLPQRQVHARGRLSYGIGLVATAAVLSVAFIPIALTLIGRILGQPMAMPVSSLGRLVTMSVLLPLAVGMLLRMVAPAVARAIAKPVAAIAIVGLVVGATAILITALPAALALVGNGTILAIAAFVALGLAVGHALGGPSLEERAVLALSTACRHPVIAIAIAGANYPEETRVPAAVVLYLLVNVAMCIPYIAWLRRTSPTGGGEPRLAT